MEPYEYEELKADIVRNGLHTPIVLYEGRILDGRNRYRICQKTGMAPRMFNYPGDDPVSFVASIHLHRRHLNPSQRAMIAARLADSKPGGDRTKPQSCGLSHGRAAARFKVSKRLVDLASALLNAVATGQGLGLFLASYMADRHIVLVSDGMRAAMVCRRIIVASVKAQARSIF